MEKVGRYEIKAVLGATDVDDLGFSLEAGQVNRQALDEVQGYVNLMASASKQVVLEDMVEARFGRRPYGWPEWEVLLLVARLVRKGDISLVMDGATLATDKIHDAVTSPSKWRRITLVKRQSVDTGQLQAARHLAKDVFGQIAPDGVRVLNLAFDVTPHRYVTGIVTENGIAYPPFAVSLRRMVTGA